MSSIFGGSHQSASAYIIMHINLLKYKDKLKFKHSESGVLLIYSLIRSKWLVYTEEEFCRQCMIHYLRQEFNFQLIAEEKKVQVNNRSLRFDILVYDQSGNPYILVEIKSFDVSISVDAILQAKNYLQTIKAPYLIITNGKSLLLWSYDYNQHLQMLDDFPSDWL